MAPGSAAPARFRRGSHAADRHAIAMEVPGSRPAGPDGSIVAASVLRAPALLLRRSDAARQRVHNQRLAPGRITDRNIRRHAFHRESILEERSEARTQTKIRKFSEHPHANYPDNVF